MSPTEGQAPEPPATAARRPGVRNVAVLVVGENPAARILLGSIPGAVGGAHASLNTVFTLRDGLITSA